MKTTSWPGADASSIEMTEGPGRPLARRDDRRASAELMDHFRAHCATPISRQMACLRRLGAAQSLAQLYLHLREPELARAVLSAARPVLEANGSASEQRIFYRYLAWQHALERQWRIDEQVIETALLAVASAKEAGEDADTYREKGPATAWATLFLGWFLLLRGGLDEAKEQLVSSLSLADRSGDLILRAFCLSNLAGVALRRHDKNAVRSLAPRAEAAGEVVHLTTVVGAAKACLAWLAWQDGRSQDIVVLANEAGELFRTPLGLATRACKWLYIWPLVAVRLQEGRVTQAVTAARELLDPLQRRLPDELQSIIESACLSWDRGEADVATGSLEKPLSHKRFPDTA